MLIHIALVTEILATLVCIHCIYGKKVRFDVWTAGLCLIILILLEIGNGFKGGEIFTYASYLFLYVYCKKKFRCSFSETVIALLLSMIIVTVAQFVCFFCISMLVKNRMLCITVGNVLMLVLYTFVFSKCKLDRIYKEICKKSKYVMLMLFFISVVIISMLLQGKIFRKLNVQYYVLVIPAIILLLYLICKWYSVQEEIEEKYRVLDENRKEYDKLLVNVRLRQHELKNHILAIFSAHYTYKTYEKLVRVQEEYCNKILNENKYNSLLLMGNNILAGYLHGKFQEAEADGIKVSFDIVPGIEETAVPMYYIIEMLGILLDNAAEAQKNNVEKELFFKTYLAEEVFVVLIRNPFAYVTYDEMIGWFEYAKSQKGNNRGLGLYHLKKLCKEWECEIGCRNVEISGENWVEFKLSIKLEKRNK